MVEGKCAAFEPVAPIGQFGVQGDANPVVIEETSLWVSEWTRMNTSHSEAKNGAWNVAAVKTGSKVVAENPKIGLCYHPWGEV